MLRHADFSLTDEQRALRETVGAALDRDCPIERVRAAEPLGFDEKLWAALVDLRAVAMGVPEDAGGDGAGLVELVLVAEQCGRHLAPAPFAEAVAAARVLARCDDRERVAAVIDGRRVVAIAPCPLLPGQPQLVPGGAAAQCVIGLTGDALVVVERESPPPLVGNHGDAPLAFWDLDAGEVSVLASGDEAREAFEVALRDLKLLTAAALVGLAAGAQRLAVEFAKQRIAFGVPIAAFQAVAHPLVDVAMAVTASRRLIWKAAWHAEHEPVAARHLVPMAFVAAAETATRAGTVAVHTLGGVGLTEEAAAQLFFRRAKAWANAIGDPADELRTIGELLGSIA